MEKHKCKLCFRSFSNGRALGGHMRSHMLNLPIVQKPESPPPPPPPLQPQPQQPPQNQLSGTLSASFSSSSSSEDDDADDDDEKGIYGLRENPKRSIRLVDPEFVDGGSVVLPDRESETESSKNPTRKRSKRTRTLDQSFHHQYHHQRIQEQAEAMKKQPKFKYKAVTADQSSWAEPEPVSSISDTTPEEDVAFCLMMLSRDKWKKQEQQQQPQGNIEEDNEDDDVDEDEDEEDEEEEEEEQEQEQEEDEAVESDESEELIKLSKTTTRTRGKFKCETCKKTFRSYQALGGHRASHKKIKLLSSTTTPTNNYEPKLEHRNVGTPEKKNHECPVCFRVFSSGQALGGHKRTHVTGSTSTPTSVRASTKLGQALIDLNLPAPIEDDDISQIELSAVSDAEFVNPIRR